MIDPRGPRTVDTAESGRYWWGMDAPRPGHRWVGVGRSDVENPENAAKEAVGGALDGRAASLVVLFVSQALDVAALARHASAEAGDAQLIGCSTAGEIAGSGPGDA